MTTHDQKPDGAAAGKRQLRTSVSKATYDRLQKEAARRVVNPSLIVEAALASWLDTHASDDLLP